jgi:hypothetical protein
MKLNLEDEAAEPPAGRPTRAGDSAGFSAQRRGAGEAAALRFCLGRAAAGFALTHRGRPCPRLWPDGLGLGRQLLALPPAALALAAVLPGFGAAATTSAAQGAPPTPAAAFSAASRWPCNSPISAGAQKLIEDPFGPRPRGAADAVDIVFRHVRHVVSCRRGARSGMSMPRAATSVATSTSKLARGTRPGCGRAGSGFCCRGSSRP